MGRSWHPASVEGRGRLHLGLQGAHIAAALVVSSSPRRRYPAHDAASADAKEVPRHVSATLAELHLVLRHVAELPGIKHPRADGAVAAAEHSSGADATSSERVHQVVQVRVALFHVRRRRPHVRGRRAHEASEHGRRAAVRARGRAHLRRLLEQSGRRHLRQHGGLIAVEPRRWNLISTTNEVAAKNPRRRYLRTPAATASTCSATELVIVHEPLACMLVTGPRAVAIVSKETQVEEAGA